MCRDARVALTYEKATLHALHYGNSVKMMMGMNQNMFVFLSDGVARFPALRSLGSDRATMCLRARINNRGHYTNTHAVLHANSKSQRPPRRAD
jgi:hypothetical protein